VKPDLACSCGGNLFSPTPVFQTFPDGRTFKLGSSGGESKLWVMCCLACGSKYIMGAAPLTQHGNTLLPVGSPEAGKFLEEYVTDGVFTE
jgi:hypothetical protein